MSKKVKNPELIDRLFYGLPDDRICKVATVVSDNGTKVVIKDRGIVGGETPVFLYKPIEYKELDEVVRELEHKEVVVTSAVYRSTKIIS